MVENNIKERTSIDLDSTAGAAENRPRGYNKFSCSTQLIKKCFLLINVKMPTTSVGILIFMSRKTSIIDLSEPGKS